jgi:hypothetical protein
MEIGGEIRKNPLHNHHPNNASNQTKLFNDDEYEYHSPSLKSLERKTLPVMPDEQDRKRFVGCLAAVLASLHDSNPEDEIPPQKITQRNNTKRRQQQQQHSFDDDDDVDDDDDEEEIYSGTTPIPTASTAKRSAHYPTMRYVQRRHEVYSRFLSTAAEMLHLDSGHSKCFVPMLEKIVHPNSTRSTTKNVQPQKSTTKTARSQSRLANAAHFLERKMDQIDHLRPFLETMGLGAGIRCLAMFLLQHLLHSSEGYDARIRHAIKTVGVLVLLHDMILDDEDDDIHNGQEDEIDYGDNDSSLRRSDDVLALWQQNESDGIDQRSDIDKARALRKRLKQEKVDLVTLATRKFESLERFIAFKLIELSQEQKRNEMEQSGCHRGGGGQTRVGSLTKRESSKSSTRQQILRGLKIGGTAVAAGTLFAITGGLGKKGYYHNKIHLGFKRKLYFALIKVFFLFTIFLFQFHFVVQPLLASRPGLLR